MIAMVSSWIKYIIFMVLFASFVELLLPSSSMQRFIRVILGLFIMLAIISPVIDVVQQHSVPSQMAMVSGSSASSNIIINHAKQAAWQSEKLTTEIYQKELAQQMKVMIVALDGVADANVVIETKPIAPNTSNIINHVMVYVTPGNATHHKIEMISIGKPLMPTTDLYSELQTKIKAMISELYQIPKNIVEIKIVHS